MPGTFMPRYTLPAVVVLLAAISVGCSHQATPPPGSPDAPAAATPAVSLENRQNKQAFVARMKQAQMRRTQVMPQKP